MRPLTARLLLAAVPLAGLAFTAPPASAVCFGLTYELGLGCNPVCDTGNKVFRLAAEATDGAVDGAMNCVM